MEERRYHGLDALRGGMMMLGIVVHAAAMYVTMAPPGLPFIADQNRSPLMDVIVVFIHSFRMPTFFVLAGFFAALLVEKRGLWGTYRNRGARVLAPFVAGMLTVLPVALVFMVDFAIFAKYGVHRAWPAQEDIERLQRDMKALGAPEGIFLGHLWFLYYLLYFYLLIPLCRLAGGRSGPGVKAFLRWPGAVAILGLYTAATLWPFPGGLVVGEFLFLEPHLPALLYYGSFFFFGYLLHDHRDFLQVLARRMPHYLVLSLALFPAALVTIHADFTHATRGTHLAAVAANGLCTWALTFLFVGCAMRFFDRPSPWILYASHSAYWVFLVHLPIVTALTWWLAPYNLHAAGKFSIVVLVTSMACFATYHFWVQRTWVSVFLNGRRFGTSRAGAHPPS